MLPMNRGERMANILLIEDDPVFGKLAKSVLEEGDNPCTVLWVQTKTEAMAILERVPKPHFDGLVLDLILSNSNGAMLVRAIEEVVPETPIILVTGMDQADVESGILPYTKPHKVLYKRGLTMDQLALAVKCRSEMLPVEKPLVKAERALAGVVEQASGIHKITR